MSLSICEISDCAADIVSRTICAWNVDSIMLLPSSSGTGVIGTTMSLHDHSPIHGIVHSLPEGALIINL